MDNIIDFLGSFWVPVTSLILLFILSLIVLLNVFRYKRLLRTSFETVIQEIRSLRFHLEMLAQLRSELRILSEKHAATSSQLSSNIENLSKAIPYWWVDNIKRNYPDIYKDIEDLGTGNTSNLQVLRRGFLGFPTRTSDIDLEELIEKTTSRTISKLTDSKSVVSSPETGNALVRQIVEEIIKELAEADFVLQPSPQKEEDQITRPTKRGPITGPYRGQVW